MATPRKRRGQGAVLSPDLNLEIDDPDVPRGPSFALQAIMELQKSHGALTQAVEHLTGAINQQSAKLDKIEEIRVDLREHTTRLSIACDDLKDTKKKVERIHTWVVGAAAIVGFLAVSVQIALRIWPAASSAPPNIVVNIPPVTQTPIPGAGEKHP